ncbi:MAG: hypothetical protein ACOYOP_07295 [Microthrixaceae bacterium]
MPVTPTATLAENPVRGVALNGQKAVTVSWTGQAANKLIYVDVCRKSTTDATFEPGVDCAPLSSLTPNGNASGSGSVAVDIFRGPDPSGDQLWGCFAPGDTAPAGIQRNTTCYVRVTNDSLFNNSAAAQVAFTLFPTGDVVLSENPVTGVALNGTKAVSVFWNNQAANKLIYVDICNKPTSTPGFEPGQDCAPLSSLTPNGSTNGSGTISVDIFRGAEPSGDLPWGCFKSSDTAPGGVTKLTTCYVRITNDTLFNNSAAKEIAFTLG